MGVALAVVGVPFTTPAVLSVKPAGSCPLVTVQLYGDVPPVVCSPKLYALPTNASGSAPLAVLTTSNDLLPIATLRVIVCAGELPSPACTVKVKLPVAVGVPVSVPSEFRVKPAGSWPLASVHAMGEIPPFDWNVKV